MSVQSILYLMPQQELQDVSIQLRNVADCLGLTKFERASLFDSGLEEQSERSMAMLEDFPSELSLDEASDLIKKYTDRLVLFVACQNEARPVLAPVVEALASMGEEGAGWIPFDLCVEIGDQSILDQEEEVQLWRGNISVSLFGDGVPECGPEMVLDQLQKSTLWQSIIKLLGDRWQSEVQQIFKIA